MIFETLKELVKTEKKYTLLILEKLMVVEKEKSYADLKYPSLHKYLIKGLGYSEAEATLRVNVVRMMIRSETAKERVLSGKMSLVNAGEANKAARVIKDEVRIEKLVQEGCGSSTRQFKRTLDMELGRQRQEVLVLKEYMMDKFDRLRKEIWGPINTGAC